jgi:hypothetical protein
MDATLVPAWQALCQRLGPTFTDPTLVTFLHIATGWVLCRGKPTITNIIAKDSDARQRISESFARSRP